MNATESAGLSPPHFLQVLWKQRACWILLWLLATAAVLAAVWLIPSRYRTEAILALEFARPPGRALAGQLDADLRARLEMARLRVLRRKRLLELLGEVRPGEAADSKPAEAPQSVEWLRSGLKITAIPESRGICLSGVRVVFEGRDRARSAGIVNGVAIALAAEFEKTSQERPRSRRLNDRLTAARSRLAECQDALKAFEAQHGRELGPRERSLLIEQGGLRAEMAAVERSLMRAVQERARLEHAASEAEKESARVQAMPAAGAGARSQSAIRRQLRERLAVLLARYKEDHPDVRQLREELAQAEALEGGLVDGARDPAAEVIVPDPAAAKARERLAWLREDLTRTEQRRRELAAEQERLARALGVVEEQHGEIASLRRRQAALKRECELAEAGYRAAALAREQGEPDAADWPGGGDVRLVLLEEALPPGKPSFPNRRLLGLLGALGALVACAVAAVGREVGATRALAALGLMGTSYNGFPASPSPEPAWQAPANGRQAAHGG